MTIYSGLRALAALAALAVGLNTYATTFSPEDGDPFGLGEGFDSISGTIAKDCLDPAWKQEEEEQAGKGEKALVSVREVSDLRDLSNAMSVRASFDATFGASSVAGSGSYLKSTTFNSYNYNMVVKVSVAEGARRLKAPRLASEYEELREKEPLRFQEQCGNEFVLKRTFGGEFLAVISIGVTSSADRATLAAALKYNGASANAAAEFQTAFNQQTANRKVDISVLRKGDRGEIGGLRNFAEDQKPGDRGAAIALLKYALVDFPDKAMKAPWVVRVQTVPYRQYARKGRDPMFDRNQGILQAMAFRYVASTLVRNNLQYARINSGEFRLKRGVGGLDEDLVRMEAYLGRVSQAAMACHEEIQNELKYRCGAFEEMPPQVDRPLRIIQHEVATEMNKRFSFRTLNGFTCSFLSATGDWKVGHGDGAASRLCSGTADFDRASQTMSANDFDANGYSDNEGKCTFHFRCEENE